ncbi:MAG: LamG domain-containing protein [Arenibacter sp.]|nr:LamG domain-containing protein [Arenibacter sp.]
MKKIYRSSSLRIIVLCLLGTALTFLQGCTVDRGDGWADERYLEDFEFYVYHLNPLTGEEYTQEELAELTYDPLLKESYSEGQPIDLSIVTSKMPSEIKVLSGRDLSVLETLTTFEPYGEKFKSTSFVASLQELGLLEIGDKMTLKFDILYVDGAIGAVNFEVKKVKFFDPNAVVDTFVYLRRSTGETTPLVIDEKVSSRIKDPAYGAIVEFDGIDDQVEILDVPELGFRHSSDYSIGFWVNTTSTDSDPVMVGDQDWGSSSNPGLTIAFRGNNWRVATSDGITKADTNYDGSFNDGEWHYIVTTFDRDGNMTLYQDGASVASVSMAGVGETDSGNPLRVGQDGTGAYGQFFQGKIGEISIYDYVLSPQQVTAVSAVKTGAQLLKQDGNTLNIAVAGTGGVNASSEDGKYAFDFDGVDDYTTLQDSELAFRHTDDFSVATWVKTSASNSDPSIIGDKDWGSGGNKGFIFAYLGGSWKLNAGDGNGNRIDVNGGSIGDGEWHLLTVTFDRDGNATVYQDGEEVGNANMSALGDMNSNLPIRLAQDGTGNYGNWFQGIVANAMIFDYVLTAEEVATLYTE